MQPEQIQFLFTTWLSSFIVVFARVLGFASQGPIMSEGSGTGMPVLTRLGFTFLITVLITPIVKPLPANPDEYNYFLCILINLLIGALIGFITNLVLNIAQAAGEIMDNSLGINSAQILNPATGQQNSILQSLMRRLGVAVFLNFGGFELALTSFVKSFELFSLTATDFSLLHLSLRQIIDAFASIMILGVITASPIMVVLIFVDVVLGLMSRSAQNINPFQLSFAIKPVIGCLILLFILPYFQRRLVSIFIDGVSIFK
jgi:flagellar biosynthetic protein FliR